MFHFHQNLFFFNTANPTTPSNPAGPVNGRRKRDASQGMCIDLNSV